MRDIDKQLLRAASRGTLEEIVSLLTKGADAKAIDDNRVTPLMVAAFKGHVGCVEALLSYSDPRAVDFEGCSALIYASQHSQLECARALLGSSDIDCADMDGMTAADYARARGDTELLDALLSYRLSLYEAQELAEQVPNGSLCSHRERL